MEAKERINLMVVILATSEQESCQFVKNFSKFFLSKYHYTSL